MTTDDYKVLIKSKDVLDRGTLNVTIEELERIGESRLTQEIKRIFADNKIEKPTNHNKQNDLTTEYYKIDLTADDIGFIVSMFGNREVESLGPNYETTRAASFYATMLDNWNRIILD
jgi:uncharacterized protein YpuA (DUF1002 family)